MTNCGLFGHHSIYIGLFVGLRLPPPENQRLHQPVLEQIHRWRLKSCGMGSAEETGKALNGDCKLLLVEWEVAVD